MEAVIIAAALPLLAETAVWITYYIGFDKKILSAFTKIYQTLTRAGEGATGRHKDNILLLDKAVAGEAPDVFAETWKRIKLALERDFNGEYIPEARFFFHFEEVKKLSRRELSKTISEAFWIFAALCLLLPVAAAFLSGIGLTVALPCAMGSFTLSAVGRLVFMFLDTRAYHAAEAAFERFIQSFDAILPVADKNTALIHEAILKNQFSFESGVRQIVAKFDGFASLTVLPALNESMSLIADLQENGMKKLAEEFSLHLTDTLDTRMTGLTANMMGIEKELTALQQSLSDSAQQLNNLLTAQRTTLEEAAHRLLLTGEQQIMAAEQAEQLQRQAFEASSALNAQLQQMRLTVKALTEQNEIYSRTSAEMNHIAQATQKSIALKLQESQNNMQQAVQECTALFDGITDKMKAALSQAGTQIANGIKETTGENAEAIEKLIEQSRIFKSEYDSYFTRIENYTASANEDMEYHVSNIIARVSETVQKLLEENLKNSLETLNDYRHTTADLLEAFGEQTASISLYAKEINMDVSELSDNLKTSVSTFSAEMKHSVESTMKEFDSGLAELTRRIANTVESICDAVETLPEAIRSAETV